MGAGQEREDLKGQREKFELCLRWLDENPNLEGKRRAHYLKDRVQNELSPHSHIPRGVFILAALYRGYRGHKNEGEHGCLY